MTILLHRNNFGLAGSDSGSFTRGSRCIPPIFYSGAAVQRGGRFARPRAPTARALSPGSFAAVAEGQITPSAAAELARFVETHARAIEVNELERRVAELEEGLDA